MFCARCGQENGNAVSFCRRCGADLQSSSLIPSKPHESWITLPSNDPDELTSSGIGSVIMGDGFLIVGIILSATESSISSLLWLFLLIPAFFFFGKGFANVLKARQIRRRQKSLLSVSSPAELAAETFPTSDTFVKLASGKLPKAHSVTERTTRELR
jgi:hypothetical protein